MAGWVDDVNGSVTERIYDCIDELMDCWIHGSVIGWVDELMD